MLHGLLEHSPSVGARRAIILRPIVMCPPNLNPLLSEQNWSFVSKKKKKKKKQKHKHWVGSSKPTASASYMSRHLLYHICMRTLLIINNHATLFVIAGFVSSAFSFYSHLSSIFHENFIKSYVFCFYLVFTILFSSHQEIM